MSNVIPDGVCLVMLIQLEGLHLLLLKVFAPGLIPNEVTSILFSGPSANFYFSFKGLRHRIDDYWSLVPKMWLNVMRLLLKARSTSQLMSSPPDLED
jgi:hypothetical protein